MSKDDHDEQKGDRAAILARRQQFIALALSSLASTACTDGGRSEGSTKADGDGHQQQQQPPQPCLSESPREIPPQVCLSPELPPQVCLKIAPPQDDTGEAETGGETETETGGETETETGDETKPAPKPCLKKAAPRPCLRKISPALED